MTVPSGLLGTIADTIAAAADVIVESAIDSALYGTQNHEEVFRTVQGTLGGRIYYLRKSATLWRTSKISAAVALILAKELSRTMLSHDLMVLVTSKSIEAQRSEELDNTPPANILHPS